jgi:hypothetical protein
MKIRSILALEMCGVSSTSQMLSQLMGTTPMPSWMKGTAPPTCKSSPECWVLYHRYIYICPTAPRFPRFLCNNHMRKSIRGFPVTLTTSLDISGLGHTNNSHRLCSSQALHSDLGPRVYKHTSSNVYINNHYRSLVHLPLRIIVPFRAQYILGYH